MAGKKFYAVKNGRETGIFTTWAECRQSIFGFSGAVYKGFETRADAEAYMNPGEADTGDGIDSFEAKAYVDGSYSPRDKRFSCGVIILHNGGEYTISQAFDDSALAAMRNVAGEIKGAEAAMRYCIENGIKSAAIYHDYEGIARWCLGEWKTNREATRQYAEFYRSIKDKLKVKFIKVKGHSGDKYNDIADRLAKEALGIS